MSAAPTAAIEVENLSVFADGTRLLGPVSLRVNAGATLVVMGETGAGKSLIAQAILGALPKGLASQGEIRLNGERVDLFSRHERAKTWGRDIAMLPQEPWRALDPLMRSAAQVAETHRFVAMKSRAEADAATRRDFATLGLTGAERRMPGALSGGMAQRVAYAAATAGGAPILIADEPTKGLDAARAEQTIGLLESIPRNGGTLLAITHDVAAARRLGGEAMILKEGKPVEQGAAARVLSAPVDSYTRSLLAAEPAAWPKFPPPRRGERVLSVRDLAVGRGQGTLIEGFNMTLHAGERVAVTGPSGAGKTSLLDTIAGSIKPASGRIERAPTLTRTGIQKLYQDPPSAFPPRIRLGQSLKDVADLHGIDRRATDDLLFRLRIDPALLDRHPAAVSGGELQRIAIVRALTARPAVLLADEPTSRLDPITQRETMELLAEIARDRKVAIVLVTHDPAMASRWTERIFALNEGGNEGGGG